MIREKVSLLVSTCQVAGFFVYSPTHIVGLFFVDLVSMKNLYQQLIQYSVEQRIKKLERQGQNFNREKIVKKMEAVNPIAIFMAFSALIWFVDDSFNFGMFNLFLPYLLIIFYALILIGLNHYFGWIRLKK